MANPLKTTVSDALHDMLQMLRGEALSAGKEGIELLGTATKLTEGVMKLSGKDQLQGLESIGHGCKSGLAAIANEHKRKIFANIIQSTLDFASNLAKVGLGILGG